MGSLRNPIGPLPSSIYWRRRAIALSLAAVLLVLVAWAVTSDRGDGGKEDSANGSATPAPSITPGPAQSGPAISGQPGGREKPSGSPSDSGSSSGSGSDPGPGSSSGSVSGDGSTNGATEGGGADGGQGSTGAAASGGTAGQPVPAGSDLPNCPSSALKLTLRSIKVSYEPGEKPSFQLSASNTSATTCKADFGPKAAVLTVKDTGDEEVWSSKDCPRTRGSVLLRVPAGQTVTHTVQWDRRQSEPRCATPNAGAVSAGTYLVEASFPGTAVLPASFRLEKD
ncbi:hypothetical protein ABZ348_18040 [Streptomyces sp. NPDC005963]|uniref:hypothetical protein n=1 Tax=Streptomyces sp. NPDC005963 TaxID=3156721 RepID=UPI0033DEFA4F